ncbi:hypothetical protein FJZ20_02550 [Candidatus Pacearchaeota archaeon]|nr:hypothetical protein [Candidatus Pacearchaeota archaeon]
MVKIVLTPEWFCGTDVFIELFSFIVLFLFLFLAIKNYKLNKNKKLLYLGLGFGLIALAQLASIITKLVLYYDIGPSQAIGQAIITTQFLSSVDIFYYAGFFFYRFLTLAGFYAIYRLPQKRLLWGDYALVGFFILLSALLSNEFFYLFHLTSFYLLLLIISAYSNIYKKNKFLNTKILITAFGILALSQIIYLFSKIGIIYVVANTLELVSYLILLFLIVRIFKHGKKKEPHGYNLKHAGYNPRKKERH